MIEKAVFQGDYVDIKFIKGRKVAQIWIEIPIEGGAEFIKAFGAPVPDKIVPVAMARLLPQSDLKEKLRESIEHEKHKRSWNEMSSAQQAGIACNEKSFWRFLSEQYTAPLESVENAEAAAVLIRFVCGVTSRSQIDSDRSSRLAWRDLYSNYRAWLQAPEQAA